MIKAIRKRARPDNLKNQVRAGGQTFARKLYLYSVVALFALLGWTFTGHWFFMDTEGVVTKDRTIIAPDYAARILQIHVKPGDTVSAGQHIATLQSREILDSIAELTSRRATVLSREAQIAGKIETNRRVLPTANDRSARAAAALQQLTALGQRGLATAQRLQDVQKEHYEAQREKSTVATELQALETELATIQASRKEMDAAIAQVQANYNGGRVVAQIAGVIGPKVPHLGQIVKSGEPLVELYRGDMFALAYMPTGRFYSKSPGENVRVTDGQNTVTGRIERIDSVTDALPPEFQVTFRAADRQQIFRVAFDAAPPFAIQAKVKVSGAWTPHGLFAMAKGAVLAVGESLTRQSKPNGARADAAR
jgi:multidrug resistance efflux pump